VGISFHCSGNPSVCREITKLINSNCIISLTFIIGIPKQIKTMFAPGKSPKKYRTTDVNVDSVRFWATITYIALLALTLAMSIWV
jgi:hypothetical protein